MDFFPFYRQPYYYYGARQRAIRGGQREHDTKKQEGYTVEQHRINKDMDKEEVQEVRNNEELGNPIFEIFGIKLYFDDVLIIALMFFLYSEGVSDNLLFIALALLLLS